MFAGVEGVECLSSISSAALGWGCGGVSAETKTLVLLIESSSSGK